MTDPDETIEAWIAGSEEAARAILMSTIPDITADNKRQAEITLRHMQTLRDALPKAARYVEVCASNSDNAKSATKKLRIRERNIEIAREFKRRAMRRGVYGGGASNLALMTEVGRLPRFNLRRSAAHIAIRAGLAELDKINSSGERRKMD
ncbi:hypothetical protein AB4853_16505 [Bradyrhizobium sp. 1050_B9_N1_2]|uniref:hypothetical protein n=1 Tax=Bradyrhizobium sp. 1050_B9_N1_2 TaxID=3238688 RepID=UPI003EDBF07D